MALVTDSVAVCVRSGVRTSRRPTATHLCGGDTIDCGSDFVCTVWQCGVACTLFGVAELLVCARAIDCPTRTIAGIHVVGHGPVCVGARRRTRRSCTYTAFHLPLAAFFIVIRWVLVVDVENDPVAVIGIQYNTPIRVSCRIHYFYASDIPPCLRP